MDPALPDLEDGKDPEEAPYEAPQPADPPGAVEVVQRRGKDVPPDPLAVRGEGLLQVLLGHPLFQKPPRPFQHQEEAAA